MPEGKSTEFLLGELSGKLDGVLASFATLNGSFSSHSEQDNRNFASVRKDSAEERTKMAKLVGGITVFGIILGWIAPQVLTALFK